MKSFSVKDFHLLYILPAYPGLTTTFVDREVLAVQALGIPLHILAIQNPITMLSPEQKEIQKIVTYLGHVRWFSQVFAHFYSITTHPWRYLSTLVYLLTRPHKTFRLRRKTLRQFNQGVRALHLLRHRRVNHIHAHVVSLGVVALVLSRLLGIPYSLTAHASGDIFVKPVLLPAKLGNAKFVATCTQYNMRYLKQIGKGVFDEKVKCIYHGLDIQHYHRRQPIIERDRPVILAVGQLKERKGFHILIDACGIIHRQGFDFECRIVGEGPWREILEEQINRLGLSERVHLLGARSHEEVFAQYEQANIFTLPVIVANDGDRDGIPNVILEAMAMELPVISTRQTAIPEVLEDGVNGLIVPPEDAQSLAEALCRLIQDPQQRIKMGNSGRNTVAEKFDPLKNSKLLLQELIS